LLEYQNFLHQLLVIIKILNYFDSPIKLFLSVGGI